MVDESDGIAEAIEGQLRVAITAAGRVGELIARAREESARRAQAASEQDARELASRFDAEKAAARADLAGVYRAEWWDRATPDQIGGAYTTARAWAGEDVEAVRAEQRIRDELRARYGIDADNAGGDPAAVRDAIERAERTRLQSEEQRRRAATEEIEAAVLLRHAEAADRDAEERRTRAEHTPDVDEQERLLSAAAEHERLADAARSDAQPRYDSAERRALTALQMEQQGIGHQAVAAKMRADVSQAKPATEAVKGKPGRGAKARPNRSRSTQAQRTELGR
ncbi:hypothetical protein J2X85_001645 [Microbacterium trichothecenolyticum]|uniref:hypothetical protein n=1 Tax=Microbacterium trichothecenolyticum TaxID=69370 RepID=UPI0028579F71|nr:hypothetical protein [Microbacterium trichothecenolyticum]MDR7184622.1 hypothetical protein [Microbacterium trichothecenolyticum]